MELTYREVGNVMLPEVEMSTPKDRRELGKYGRMRKHFLQEHRPMTFEDMKLTETLLPSWLQLVVNTVLILLFVAMVVKRDLPLASLPVVGRYFRR